MFTTSLLPLPLSLNLVQHTRWTAVQESGLQTYPFTLEHEGSAEDQVKQNVVRVYLQFLWLPESIMTLSLLVPAIASASLALSQPDPPTSPHPLHRLLEPLILTPRAASNKYNADLPQILVDGGGAGEIEEQMMWFALSYEKGDEHGGADQSVNEGGGVEETEPWRNEKWRKGWLERMERREVQIQILLHFVKLSLPGPKPPDEAEKSSEPARMLQRPYLARKSSRRQSKKEGQDKRPTLSTREALEIYMDKMSTWQLLSGIEQPADILNNYDKIHGISSKDDERDWIQIFVIDIVEKQFRPYLPDLCDLFRQKVLPASPFADSGDDLDLGDIQSTASTRSNSPVEGESVSSLSRSISTSSSLRRKSEADVGNSRLSRSRSLSVSLQQERESQRDASHQHKSKKRTLNREVSMSFRAKSKGQTPGPENPFLTFGIASGLGVGGQKPLGTNHKGKGKGAAAKVDAEITLVEATPMKNRIKAFSTASMTSLGKEAIPKMAIGQDQGRYEKLDVDADIWESELPKTGDIIVRTEGEDDEVMLVAETPTKVKSRTKALAVKRGRS
ncbi:hypothetical protein JOM56_007009 [Amanita muscaria]